MSTQEYALTGPRPSSARRSDRRVRHTTLRLAPEELRPGDTVVIGSESAIVVSEPLIVHRGLGMFDELQLLIGASVRFAGAGKSEFQVWEPSASLEVHRGRKR